MNGILGNIRIKYFFKCKNTIGILILMNNRKQKLISTLLDPLLCLKIDNVGPQKMHE